MNPVLARIVAALCMPVIILVIVIADLFGLMDLDDE